MYLIDANNLAGQLGWLNQDNFDQKLTQVLIAYFQAKNKRAVIVFDGNDYLAGQQIYGLVKIIYANSDYSADDKIIALIKQSKRGQAFSLVTNDRELARQARQAASAGKTIRIIQATKFAHLLLAQGQDLIISKENNSADKQLDPSEAKKINQELLRLWSG